MSELDYKETIEEIEVILSELNSSLPSEVKIASIAKIPFKVLSWRETLLYRTTELANSALMLFKNKHYVSSAVLIRAQMETTGFIVWSYKKISKCLKDEELGDIDNFLMRGLFGGREEGRIINSHNVLTAIDNVCSEFEEFRELYDMLSEFAHPNYHGTHGSFAKLDENNFRIKLGFYINNPPWNYVLTAFLFSLMVFKDYYNNMADLIMPFKSLCELKLK
jgi:hypothetical protein